MNVIQNSDNKFFIKENEIRKKIKNNIQKTILDKNRLDNIELYIIDIISKFQFMTLNQIYTLCIQKYKIITIELIENKITLLYNSNILGRDDVYIHSKKEFTFYYILNNYNIINNTYISNKYVHKNLIEIKKRLEGNEIIISFITNINHIEYEIDKKIISKKFSKIFIVEGADIIILKKDSKFDLWFEVIRRERDWKIKIINKLKLYKSFYDDLEENTEGYLRVPQLILVCEDNAHILELAKQIIYEKCIIDKIKLYFSTDLRISRDIINCIVEVRFNKEKNKYEVINKRIKIN